MTATTARAPQLVTTGRGTLTALTAVEAKRFARHPLFLVGSLLCLWVVWWIGSEDEGPARLDFQAVAAFFVGVPFAAGLVLVGLHLMLAASSPTPDWMYGTYGPVDQAIFKAVLPAIACLGGPLLGVAAGRWLRFPGAALLGVVALLACGAMLGYAPQSMDDGALLTKVLHVLSPWMPFGSENGDGVVPTTEVISYTGSPVLYGLYLLALCGLAVTAALWRDAEGAARRVGGRTFVGLAILAVALVAAAAVGGNDQSMLTTPDGVSRPALVE